MERFTRLFRVLAFVALLGVIITSGYTAWGLTKHHWLVGNLLLDFFGEESLELQGMIAWFCIAALLAPGLAFLSFLSLLGMVWKNPTDPAGMRRKAESLLREAATIERWEADRKQDRLTR
jgi:hypothetical protein